MSSSKTAVPQAFEKTARTYLDDAQLRRNLGHATRTIRNKRNNVVGEMPDWEELRESGRQIKQNVMSLKKGIA